MGLAGCGKFVKFTMVIANILIFIGGISVLAVGIWTAVDKTTFVEVIGSDLYLSAAYIMIVTGSVIAIISFLGCAGAWMENKCLLVTYFIILLLIFIVLLVAGILGYVYKGEISSEVRKKMHSSIKKGFANNKKLEAVYNDLQKELKCCGVKESSIADKKPHDAWSNDGERKIPESCCNLDMKKDYGTIGDCQGNADKYAYKKDCYDAIKTAAGDHAMVVGGVGVGIACVLLLGMIFSFILCMTIQ